MQRKESQFNCEIIKACMFFNVFGNLRVTFFLNFRYGAPGSPPHRPPSPGPYRRFSPPGPYRRPGLCTFCTLALKFTRIMRIMDRQISTQRERLCLKLNKCLIQRFRVDVTI